MSEPATLVTAPQAPPPSHGLHDLVTRAADVWPGRPALRDRSRTVTFAELAGVVGAWSRHLAAAGLQPGGRAAVLADSTIEVVAALLGAVAAGGIAVPLHPGLGPAQLQAALADAEPDVIVTLDRPWPAGVDHPASRVTTAPPLPYRDPDDRATAPDQPALLLYTSGSTTQPKAVVSLHRNVVFATGAIQSVLRYDEGDIVFCALPLAFDYGLYQVFLALVSGACVALEDPDGGPALLARLVDRSATIVPVVPGIAHRLVRLAARRRAAPRPGRVRQITNTGDVLGPSERSGLRAAFPGAGIVPMFGLTECKRVTIASPDEDLTCPTGLGRPLPGTEIGVVDDRGDPLPPGHTGQLVVTGPHVMAGYWRAPELSRSRFRATKAGVTLRTGDHGHLDDAGRFHFQGRRDDLFKLRGLRVSGTEIEAAARDVDGVAAAVVLTPTGANPGTLVVAGSITPSELVEQLTAVIGAAKVPTSCRVVDELPYTTNGKVDRKALRARLAR